MTGPPPDDGPHLATGRACAGPATGLLCEVEAGPRDRAAPQAQGRLFRDAYAKPP